ncbi:hypothetical protein HA402_009535 [Bradysia odoriphaga]|nr:hypothetical protein HA402_009535 [Bradysia odoriphaga]
MKLRQRIKQEVHSKLKNDPGLHDERSTKARDGKKRKALPKKKTKIDKSTDEELYCSANIYADPKNDKLTSSDDDLSTDEELYCPSLPDVDAPSEPEDESIDDAIMSDKQTRKRKFSNNDRNEMTEETSAKKKCVALSKKIIEGSKIKKKKPVKKSSKSPKSCTKRIGVKKQAKTTKKQNNWINGDFEKTTRFPHRGFEKYAKLSATELFELFFTEGVFKHIQLESTKYALSLNCPDPNITVSELKCFFGILILSGYNKLPGKTFYWDNGADVGNEFVKSSMRRDRFVTIMRFMHWADNSKMSETDKLWKIRPVADMIQQQFFLHFVPLEHMNFDESMVRYYGRHAIKQCIKIKPVPFGFKVWCLNTHTGYLVSFEIYQGKNHKPQFFKLNDEYVKKFGKSTAPLVHMLDQLPEKDLPFQIYTDNLFTSFNLLTELRQRGYGVTATVRTNRLPADIPLPSKSEMEKKGRGAFKSKISKDNGIITVRWTDNAVVSMASTTYGVQPMTTAKRYSKLDRKYVEVDRPHMIAMYNKYMGGTDRMDQDIGRNRINIRGKKWYWPLLTWLIDAAIHNAWTLYKSSGRKLTNFKFKRILARTYMQRFGLLPKKKGRPFSKGLPDEPRFDGLNHFVEFTRDKKRRQCAMRKCKSSVRTQCKKCDRGICIGCFVPYHTMRP